MTFRFALTAENRRLSSVEGRERLFVERYPALYKWALQFSAGDRETAEDLVQDAFIHFTTCSIEVDAIRSVDKYLYVVLRNLYRSRLASLERSRCCSLDILDRDSVSAGLRDCSFIQSRQVLDDLRRTCAWVCSRKESSTMASALILKFFHGLTVPETAALMATSRAAVDERLRVARHEARAYLENPAKLRVLGAAGPSSDPLIPPYDSDEDLRSALIDRIFKSRCGACPEPSALREAYAKNRQGLPVKLLAHIVSCPDCLAAACRITGALPPGSGEDPPQPPPPNPFEPPVQRWRRNRSSVLRDAPAKLAVAVNGRILGTHAVAPGYNEFTLYLAPEGSPEFVEVFTETGARVLFHPVVDLPPAGKSVQRASVRSESGRSLHLELDFEAPWPAVKVIFDEPASLPAPARAEQVEAPVFRLSSPRPAWWPPFVTATAGVLVFIIALNLANPARVSAAQVLSAASQWESSTTDGRDVLYRRYRLTLPSSAKGESRTLAVWRHIASRERRIELSDQSGMVIATAHWKGFIPRPTDENLWQFEPAADVFQALVPVGESIEVLSNGREITLETSAVRMTLDRATHRPTVLTLRRGVDEVRVAELRYEALPSLPSPDVAPEPLRPVPAPPASSPVDVPKPEPTPSASVDEIELAARDILLKNALATYAAVSQVGDTVRVELPAFVAPEVEDGILSLGRVSIARVDPAAAVAEAVPLPLDTSGLTQAPKPEPLLEGELVARFRTIEAAASWTGEIHERVREMNALTGGLVELARRYPPELERALSTAARARLARMIAEAEDRLKRAASQLIAHSAELDVLRAALSSPAAPIPLAPAWRDRALQLSALAWEIQSSSMHLFAGVVSGAPSVAGSTAVNSFSRSCTAVAGINTLTLSQRTQWERIP
jgi:RNA polymerase sigma factor (sigma-70 family)